MQKDRLATLTMDIVVNHPTKRIALDAAYSRLSPWAQSEWDSASDGVSITERAARLDHSIREQRRCDESLIEHIFAALNGRTFVVLDATYCFMTQRMLDQKTGRRIPPDAVRRFASQSITSLLLNSRAHQDLKQCEVHTIGDLLPHAYEWLSPKRLAPGKPPTGKSIGLVSMAERAREFGGSLSVQPGAAGGACLRLDLTLEDAP